MYSKILNMTMINTNPNPEYDMAKNTLLIESTIPLDIADANKIIGQNSMNFIGSTIGKTIAN